MKRLILSVRKYVDGLEVYGLALIYVFIINGIVWKLDSVASSVDQQNYVQSSEWNDTINYRLHYFIYIYINISLMLLKLPRL